MAILPIFVASLRIDNGRVAHQACWRDITFDPAQRFAYYFTLKSGCSMMLVRHRWMRRRFAPAATWRPFASSSTGNDAPLCFLIVEGYSAEGRKELQDHGAGIASDLYANMLAASSGDIPITYKVVYPTDGPFEMPDLSTFDGVAWTGCR